MRVFTEEWRKKLSESAKKRHIEGRNKNLLVGSPKGLGSYSWKDNISYKHLHSWLIKTFPKKGVCDFCKTKGKTDYANKSGFYKRDRNDFYELCRSCHSKIDNKMENFYKSRL